MNNKKTITTKIPEIKIVTIGGGTGSFTILSELRKRKENGKNLKISAIVAMSDSGGSTGVLRDEYGVLPAGDVRQCLVALSPESEFLRKLFIYRYEEGFLAGHNFGNIFLSTIEKLSESFPRAVREAEKILNTAGRIFPVTMTKNDLIVEKKNGEKIISEKNIDNADLQEIKKIYLDKKTTINPKIPKIISEADIVIIAPGNFYNSIIPNFLVTELAEHIKKSKAKTIFITNITTKKGHTDNFYVDNFVEELYRHSEEDNFIDYVFYNSQDIVPENVKKAYAEEESALVKTVKNKSKFPEINFISSDFISKEIFENKNKKDIVKRALLRHNVKKLFDKIFEIIKK